MRKHLLIAASLLASALSGPALAADMAVKAPPANPFINPSASGWYWLVGTYAGVAQSNVSGNNLLVTSLVSSNLTADGAGVDVGIGYIHGDTTKLGIGNWWRVEFEGSYQNIQGGISVPGSSAGVASRWSATQEFDVGADVVSMIQSVLGSNAIAFPTFAPASLLPANLAVATTPKQYFGVVLREFGIDGQFGQASGASVGVAPGIKSGFLYQALGADGKPNGTAVDIWASVTWAVKGFTLNNVLAANGAPLSVNGGYSMGSTYLAGVHANFSLGAPARAFAGL